MYSLCIVFTRIGREREREKEREREMAHIVPVLCVVLLLHLGHPRAVLLDDSMQLFGVVLLQFKLVSLKSSYGSVQLDCS